MSDSPNSTPPPGFVAGGWVPGQGKTILLSVAVGVFTSVGAIIALPGLTLPVILGAVITGAGTGLATYLGTSSAGTRKPPPSP